MLATALLMAAVLGSADLGASDPDGVVATARPTPTALDGARAPEAPTVEGAAQLAAPHGLTTNQQIDRWLESRDPASIPYADGEASPPDDREMHGEVRAGIGTGGYRDFGVAVSFPLGENGRLDLSYRQVENGYPGYGYGYGYGYDYGYGYPLLEDRGSVFPGSYGRRGWEREQRGTRPGGWSRLTVEPPTAVE